MNNPTKKPNVPPNPPPLPVSQLDDPDMQAVPRALYRAARLAHLIAHHTGTGVVVEIDGEIVEIEPDPKMYEGLPMEVPWHGGFGYPRGTDRDRGDDAG